jgi:hypothetical protein
MGLTVYPITSIKLEDGSNLVDKFECLETASVGDIINLLDVDYQIKNIVDDTIILNKKYIHAGKLTPDKMVLKKLPSYIKSQVSLIGELVLITVEDSLLESNRLNGLTIPGWYNIITTKNADGTTRIRSELLKAIRIYDEVIVPPIPVKPEPATKTKTVIKPDVAKTGD